MSFVRIMLFKTIENGWTAGLDPFEKPYWMCFEGELEFGDCAVLKDAGAGSKKPAEAERINPPPTRRACDQPNTNPVGGFEAESMTRLRRDFCKASAEDSWGRLKRRSFAERCNLRGESAVRPCKVFGFWSEAELRFSGNVAEREKEEVFADEAASVWLPSHSLD